MVAYWQEKAPYEAKAAKRKSEYEKLMAAYNKKQVNGRHSALEKEMHVMFQIYLLNLLCLIQVSSDDEEEAESESSKSQVNDKDDEESEVIYSS